MTDAIPQADEAERAVIGCLLHSDDAIGKALDAGLRWDDFRSHHLGLIYREATACHLAKPDRIAVEVGYILPRLIASGSLDDARWRALMRESYVFVQSDANTVHYAKDIVDAHQKRKILGIGLAIESHARNGAAPEEIVQDAKARIEDHETEFQKFDKAWAWVDAGSLAMRPKEDISTHFWPNLVAPCTTTLIFGGPGSGKSTLIDGFIRALACGEGWLGLAPRGTTVKTLIVSEESEWNLARRFRRVGMPHGMVFVLPRKATVGKPWPAIVEQAGKYAAEIGAEIVVFDTLRGLAGFTDKGENDAQACGAALNPVVSLAEHRNLACIVVHHTRKQAPGLSGVAPNVESAAGSLSLAGYVDVQIGVAFPKEPSSNQRTLHVTKSRLDYQKPFVIETDKTGEPWLFTFVGTADDIEHADVDAAILAVLEKSDKWMTKEQIVEATGGNRATAKKRIEALYFQKPAQLQRAFIASKRNPHFARLGLDPSVGVAAE